MPYNLHGNYLSLRDYMTDIDDIATRIAGIIISPDSVNGLIKDGPKFIKIMVRMRNKLNAA